MPPASAGFINMHGHLHTSRAGRPMPLEYQYKLWLGSGITTVRDVGSDGDLILQERERSEAGEIAAPRLSAYLWFPNGSIQSGWGPGVAPSENEIRSMVRKLKKRGADGIKVRHFDRKDFLIIGDEARKQGLKIAHHVGIEDTNAWDVAAVGVASIEHWYGVPDAALQGIQSFPADFNHTNELHRFRYAGRLWREADPDRVQEVLQTLVDAGVAWNPTLCIYEASRDLQRALTQPAFKEYLHPSLEAYFAPNPKFHGSFFFGWTNTDEVYWKENYRIWMQAIRDFADMGGIVTTGEDAGFIYQVYGFGYLRELQLHEEAGFHPLEVIKHATWNGAQVLGRDDELGRLKPGYRADVVVVNGNPLADLQILMPRGLNPTLDDQRGDAGGIEWTIKDGIPYSSPRLFAEVRALVSKARLAE
ncbi:MAG: amidohydrolase [Candidatus Hydrogenedentota bacterium]|nr:MAG: amidohydrolase [Candidatus Hydrogenedentota bacterium]